jgi:dTDP-4-dehydrorhamnose reductase
MRPARVLILGGTGMLGSMLWRRLSAPGRPVRRSQRRDRTAAGFFDALGEPGDLDRILVEDGRGPDFVVNALGLTRVGICEGDPSSEAEAWAVNAELPKRLARAAARHGARVIHVSSDGVFSGRIGHYDESAVPDPPDLYGRTKLEGEVAESHVLTVRCSLVGPDPEKGRGLFEWFRRLGGGSTAQGFVDQLWSGVTTLQFAELCHGVIEQGARGFDQLTAVAPIRHFCPNPPVSKYELLRAFAAALGSSVQVTAAASGKPVNRVLCSRWHDLDDLVGGGQDLQTAVTAMLNVHDPLKTPR